MTLGAPRAAFLRHERAAEETRLMGYPWFNFAVALGLGLLIGLERERSKGEGPTRGPAGIRTFARVAATYLFGKARLEPRGCRADFRLEA
jgi:hypothetical protein